MAASRLLQPSHLNLPLMQIIMHFENEGLIETDLVSEPRTCTSKLTPVVHPDALQQTDRGRGHDCLEGDRTPCDLA